MWNVETGVIVGTIPSANLHSRVNSVAFSSDGKRVILGSDDGRIRVWDSQLYQSFSEALFDPSEHVQMVAISLDGLRVASLPGEGSMGPVGMWDAETGILTGKLQHSYHASCICFSPDGRRLVSGHTSGALRLWDLETFTLIGDTMRGHTGAATCVAFSFDGFRIVSGSLDKMVRVWDAVSPMPIGHPFHELCVIRYVAESADGVYIVTGFSEDCDGMQRHIRNRNTGKVVWRSTKFENSDCIEKEIGYNEAVEIWQSCRRVMLVQCPSISYRGGGVCVEGNQMHSHVLDERVLLGSMPGTRKPVDWKYHANRGVFAAGLGSGGASVAICTAVLNQTRWTQSNQTVELAMHDYLCCVGIKIVSSGINTISV